MGKDVGLGSGGKRGKDVGLGSGGKRGKYTGWKASAGVEVQDVKAAAGVGSTELGGGSKHERTTGIKNFQARLCRLDPARAADSIASFLGDAVETSSEEESAAYYLIAGRAGGAARGSGAGRGKSLTPGRKEMAAPA